jgi:hypothetical protein
VPVYRAALERTLGPDALERLVADLESRESILIDLGRTLFERWLDLPDQGERPFPTAP